MCLNARVCRERSMSMQRTVGMSVRMGVCSHSCFPSTLPPNPPPRAPRPPDCLRVRLYLQFASAFQYAHARKEDIATLQSRYGPLAGRNGGGEGGGVRVGAGGEGCASRGRRRVVDGSSTGTSRPGLKPQGVKRCQELPPSDVHGFI